MAVCDGLTIFHNTSRQHRAPCPVQLPPQQQARIFLPQLAHYDTSTDTPTCRKFLMLSGFRKQCHNKLLEGNGARGQKPLFWPTLLCGYIDECVTYCRSSLVIIIICWTVHQNIGLAVTSCSCTVHNRLPAERGVKQFSHSGSNLIPSTEMKFTLGQVYTYTEAQ